MSKLVVIFTLFFTTLFSNQVPESFPFFGLTGTHNQISFSKASTLPREKEIFPGLRFGEQTLDWRTMFTVSGKKEKYDVSLEIDKILLDDIFGYPEIRPYLGASVGYLHYEDIGIDKANGYYFGGAFGFLIYLTDNIDLDVSYHYNEVRDIDFMETIKGPAVGVHYFY